MGGLTLSLNMRDAELLIFAHILKTAGSTLAEVMQRQFRPDEIVSYEDDLWAVRIADFADRAAAGLKGIRCVMGHVPFGVHQAMQRDVTYLTMLRDPVEWTLSYFSYLKERFIRARAVPDDGTIPQRAAFAGVDRMSLDEFVQFMEDVGLANYQTRFVSGLLALRNPLPPHPSLPPHGLDLAKANLFASHTVFGLVEHFDLSLLLFKKRLGWRNIYYRKVNATEDRLTRAQVPARTLARIQELHGDDRRLYEAATHAFWQSLVQAGLHRPYVRYRFRAANTVAGGARRLRRLARRTLEAVGSTRQAAG